MNIPETLKWQETGKTLGQGGQATVVEVIDKTTEDRKTYALKALSEGKPQKVYERFIREIDAIKKLNHPSIIKIVDHSEPNANFHYYVMELIPDAMNLKKRLLLKKNPFYLNPLKALGLFMQIAEMIKACEIIKITHRDLSPANILILPDDSIRVIDFGLCHIEDAQTITLNDEGVGTPNYMAPECESGAAGDITSSSDLYSAGKILWSAVTGLNAFARESAVFNMKSMVSLFPERPDTWQLHHIFEKTIRRDPKNRWKNADEALKDAKKIYFLINAGYPALELIDTYCPICGYGTLQRFEGGHVVFGNPNPHGISSLQCTYCCICFAINTKKRTEMLEARRVTE